MRARWFQTEKKSEKKKIIFKEGTETSFASQTKAPKQKREKNPVTPVIQSWREESYSTGEKGIVLGKETKSNCGKKGVVYHIALAQVRTVFSKRSCKRSQGKEAKEKGCRKCRRQ